MAEIAEVVIGEPLLSHLNQLFACGFVQILKRRRKVTISFFLAMLPPTMEKVATGSSPDRSAERSWANSGMLAVAGIAAASFVLHMIVNGRYGYFRDEFDYIICGNHPAWGYVDQPSLVPILSRIFRAVFGDSLRSIRLMPVLSTSALILLTGVITRELGGKRFAVVLSALTILIAPIYLSGGSLLTSNCCLEVLLWMGCVYFAILAAKRDQPRYWLWFGVVAGIGLQEKYSIAVLGFAIVIGLLLTRQRRFLLSPWMWLGGAAAFLIFLPNLLWNVANHWPFVQLMRNIKAEGRDVVLSPWQYFSQQILLIHPVSALIWITGVIALLAAPRFKPYRFLGFAYLVGFAVFVALKGKNYYLAPIYPVYLAAGCVVIDDAIDRLRQGWRWLKPAMVVLLLAAGAVFAPLAAPILPIEQFIPYMERLPIKVPRSEHSHMRALLPQHYADQFGWNEIVDEVAIAWNRIPNEERKDCGIFAQDYGQAGAIDFLGPKYGLPQSLSGHQSWWLWGPRGYSGNCLIVLDDSRERLEELFKQVEFVGTSRDNPYALERELPVFICRGAKFGGLAQLWPSLKKWR
jgi:4-amino-4-deoxy-L-arabinose transferase-like glycosyltransferase